MLGAVFRCGFKVLLMMDGAVLGAANDGGVLGAVFSCSFRCSSWNMDFLDFHSQLILNVRRIGHVHEFKESGE